MCSGAVSQHQLQSVDAKLLLLQRLQPAVAGLLADAADAAADPAARAHRRAAEALQSALWIWRAAMQDAVRDGGADVPTRAFEALRANGIGVNLHYIPVHLQPYYRGLGFGPGDFPASEDYYARAISIPLHAGLTDDEQGRVAAALSDAIAS